MKLGKDGLGQTNMVYGWIFVSLYWAIGAIVGYQYEFLSIKAMQIPTPVTMNMMISYIVATIVTIACGHVMSARNDSFGRPTNSPVVVIFAIMNGIFETFLFFACYDWGCTLWSSSGGVPTSSLEEESTDEATSSSYSQIAIGFTVFSLYAGAIHALFWLPCVFPPHIRVDAPPFHIHGLPALMAMSIAWLSLYKMTNGSITIPCLLHMYIDAMVCLEIGMPGPFSPAIVIVKEAESSSLKKQS